MSSIGVNDYRFYIDGGDQLPENPSIRVAQPSKEGLFGEEGMTFADALDVVNPLHHIPLVNIAYREITGDTIKPGARLIGGTIFGGPIGMMSAAANAAVEEEFGKDIGGTVVALISGEEVKSSADKYHGPNGTQFTAYRAADDLVPGNNQAAAPGESATKQVAAVGGDAAATSPVLLPTAAPAAGLAPARPGSYGGLATMPAAGASPMAKVPSATQVAARAAVAPPAPAPAPSVAAPAPAPAPSVATPATPATDDVAAAAAALLNPPADNATPAVPAANVAAKPPASPTPAAPAVAPPIPTAAQPRPSAPERQLAMPTRNNLLPGRMPVADSRFEPQRPARANLSAGDSSVGAAAPAPAAAPTPAVQSAPAGAAAVPPAGVQDAMMRALEKYDALVKARRSGPSVTEES